MISSHTFVSFSFDDLCRKFNHALNIIHFKPTLAFAFVSIEFPLPQITDLFNEQHIALFGTTTGGEILFHKKINHIGERSAVIVLTDISPDCFSLYFEKKGDLSSFELGQSLGDKIFSSYQHPSVIIGSSGILMDGQALVDGILSKTGKQLPMFGGLAGDDARFEKTFVFTERFISDNGALVLVFNQNKIEISGMTASGWISLGAEFIVDRSEGNTVFEINGLPALDMYMDYLSVKEEDLPAIAMEYPFMVKNDGGPAVLRAITGIDKKQRSLVFSGTVAQGSTVSFSTSPGFEIMENTREKIIDCHLRENRTDLLLLFSCIARHVALGPLISTEIKLASIKWKRPLAGFFTYGEIGNDENGECSFHNHSFTLALLREKRN